MKTFPRIFTAIAFCLCLMPLGAIAADGAGTEESGDAAFSAVKPRTQKQFDEDMKALHRECGDDIALYNARVAEEERKWKNEVTEYNRKVEEWNESHADSPQETIAIEDDSDYENQDFDEKDDGGDGEIDYDNLDEDDIGKLVAGIDIDNPDIVDDHQEGVSEDEIERAKRKAYEEDGDDLGDKIEDWAGNVWADPAMSAEGAVMAKAESMANTGAKKIQDKFFSVIIEGLPFFNDHKDAYEKMVGYTKTETITEREWGIVGYRWESWGIFTGGWNPRMRVPIYGWKTKTTTREVHQKGTIEEEIEEPDVTPDWGELPEAPDNYLDEENFSAFDWNFGGFGGGKSVWGGDPGNGSGPVIGDLKMSKDGLSFKYENGLAGWGLKDDEAEALACLFVKDKDGKWIGGKFDWISTSRRTRDFENIYSGYNGWDLTNVPKTTEAAFVIVSKNGKWRSNVITALWER